MDFHQQQLQQMLIVLYVIIIIIKFISIKMTNLYELILIKLPSFALVFSGFSIKKGASASVCGSSGSRILRSRGFIVPE